MSMGEMTLKNAILLSAGIRGSTFEGVDFTNANLSNAALGGSGFESCVLQNVNLTAATLEDISCNETTLSGSILSGAGLRRMKPYGFIGEIGLLLNKPRTATIQAMETSMLVSCRILRPYLLRSMPQIPVFWFWEQCIHGRLLAP